MKRSQQTNGFIMSQQSPLEDPKLFRRQCYVDGAWRDADGSACIEVDNPATGEIIGHVPRFGAAETEAAIDAAARAFPAWRARTASERSELLMGWFALMLEHQEDLARLMTLEQGKPLRESRGEVTYAAEFVRWFAEEGKRAYGDVVPPVKAGQHIVVVKQPVGVTAAITPWNFPAAMITRKAGAALAAGCPMVVKPAEATPFSALAMAELADRAGIPAGVLNVITGDPPTIGETLTGSRTVRKLSFTGSTRVGSMLMAQCAEHITNVSLELGGNAPFLVFDDADIEAAVAGAVASKFRNSGQTCVCVNRFFVQAGVHDAFVDGLAEAMKELRVGDGFDESTDIAALINAAAVEKVQAHVDDAVARGATVVVGGKPDARGGNYFAPTLLDGVTPDMRCCREETFGPVASVLTFGDDDEGIRMANDTPYGLAAYFYSRDVHRVWHVAEALESGIVGINEGIVSTPVAPFGGVKASGLGREGSKYGLEEYLEIKYLCYGGPAGG